MKKRTGPTIRIPIEFTMRQLFIYLSILMFLSCKSQKHDIHNMEKGTAQTSLTLLLSDNYAGTDQRQMMVIRNPKELKTFFTKVNKTRKPGLAIPEIDFTKEMAVIYCSGKMQGGEAPVLFSKKVTDKQMMIGVKKNNEKPTSTALITPFSLYKMEKTDKEIILDESR